MTIHDPLDREIDDGLRFARLANDRLRHMLIGYARVSKADGSHLQRDALRAAGVDAVNSAPDG